MGVRQWFAWGVHAYTATGGIIGIFALFAAADGLYREAFLLLVVSMIIDSTDGLAARRLRVREVLPRFDGAMVDNVIDIFTYVWVPIFIIGRLDVLPHPLWLALPTLAALYAYGQADMKTEDGFFIGFPSYWNIIALYLYWLRPEPIIALLILVVPAVLSFVPSRYLYPSKGDTLWRTTWALVVLWFSLVIYLLLQAEPPSELIWLSLAFPAYYMVASFIIDFRLRQKPA